MAETRHHLGLGGRLLTRYLIASAVSILLLGVVLQQATRRQVTDDLTESMAREAGSVALAVAENPRASLVDDLAVVLDGRITVIDESGTVLVDSAADPATMDNHSDRPEVIEAREKGIGVATRRSNTLSKDLHYVAVGSGDGGVVRLAVPLERVDRLVADARADALMWVVVVFILGAAAVWLIGRRLADPLSNIAAAASGIADGNYDTRLTPVPPREVGRLAHVVNSLADEIGVQMAAVQNEQATRDSILSSVDLGVLLVGKDDEMLFVNEAAISLMGHAPAKLTEVLPAGLQGLIRQARANQLECEMTVEHGAPVKTLLATARPHADKQVLVTARDITEQLRFAAARRDFVADASHELKTPLASIRSAAETVQRALDDDVPAARRFTRQIEEQAERLGCIVSDLLELSRLEGDLPSSESVAIDQVVAEEANSLRGRAVESGVVLETDLQPVSLRGNRHDLGTLVRNLIDNAIRYTPTDGRVEISLRVEDGCAVLRASDTGPGVALKDQHRIFERFYRVDPARSRETGGTGLGLAIAKHITESHGGSIGVTSTLGEGAVFTVRIPV